MLCGGHVLLEDVPGVGKTQLAAALSKSIGGEFHRIQLTPDIMPSDITGYSVVNQQDAQIVSPMTIAQRIEVIEERQIANDAEMQFLRSRERSAQQRGYATIDAESTHV